MLQHELEACLVGFSKKGRDLLPEKVAVFTTAMSHCSKAIIQRFLDMHCGIRKCYSEFDFEMVTHQRRQLIACNVPA